jgi:DtxR family Mn-dependent transcriptional regulator
VQSNFSIAEENYIKAIFHLQQATGSVTTNELSARLNTKPASATDMLKKLKAKNLLHYEPYKVFHLTAEGSKIGLDIIRRHRLWEYFLVETLGFGWSEVHEVAEELEHVGSKKLIDKLDAFLDYPKFDPHGDPIPDINGKMSSVVQVCLAALPLGKQAQVTSVGSQSNELLQLLSHKNITLGTKLEMQARFDFDNSVEVKIKDFQPVTLSEQLAKVLFVKML